MFLILDEWVIHDLQNDNGKEKQRETFLFLKKIEERKFDKLVIVKNSKFIKKLYNFLGISDSVEFKTKSRFLVRSLIQDFQKTEFVELAILINEKQINNKILLNVNVDDHYLVLAYFYFKTKEDTIIVTTDKKLKETLEQNGIFIKFRDEFLNNY
jgi:hypothetical protein